MDRRRRVGLVPRVGGAMTPDIERQRARADREERWSHVECLDGRCGACEGRGTVSCSCLDCGHSHDRRCGHCDGRGNCTHDGNAVLREIQDAKDQWNDIAASTHHPLTREGFRKAYAQMFGAAPQEQAVESWWDGIADLADAATFKTNEATR